VRDIAMHIAAADPHSCAKGRRYARGHREEKDIPARTAP